VRTSEGQYAEFDAPGSDPVVGGTYPQAINNRGEVAGIDFDGNGVGHGFVRTPNGKVHVFDAPGASATPGAYLGTQAVGINKLGAVLGIYFDARSNAHGFLRGADGNIVTFESPTSGTGAYQGTWPYNINDFGAIAGAVTDSTSGSRSFVRMPDGRFVVIDLPGSAPSPSNNALINDWGIIAGYYETPDGTLSTGYVRTPNGRFTVFQAPGAGTAPNEGTTVNGFNDEGAITGTVIDANAERHAFVRDKNGRIQTFDIPGQLAVPGSNLGSAGVAIDASVVVAGEWHDANYVAHGYIRFPDKDGQE